MNRRDFLSLVFTMLLLTGCGNASSPEMSLKMGQFGVQRGPDLEQARLHHASVVLADGRVLVCGGIDGSKEFNGTMIATGLRSCNIFERGAWLPVRAMKTPRFAHRLVLLSDGRVMAIGGQDEQTFHRTAEIFDPVEDSWALTGAMEDARIHFTATVVGQNVLVAGGVGKTWARNELYVKTKQDWEVTSGQLEPARLYHLAALLPNQQVLVAGGLANADGDKSNEVLSNADIFDFSTQSWTPTAPTRPRSGHTMTVLNEDEIMVTGGMDEMRKMRKDVEIYDVHKRTWRDTTPMNFTRTNHTAILLMTSKKRLLVVGGMGADENFVPEVEVYDRDTEEWSIVGRLEEPRFWHSAELLPDGRVLVFGGFNGEPIASSEIITPVEICASHLDCASGQRCGPDLVCIPDPVQSN